MPCRKCAWSIAEDQDTAEREIVDAEAAFGWLAKELLAKASEPALAAGAAGGAGGRLLLSRADRAIRDASPTSARSSTTISARTSWPSCWPLPAACMCYIPQQLRREWKKSPLETGDVVHLPEATALIVGVGGIGAEAARLLAAFGMTVLATDARRTAAPPGSRSCIRRRHWKNCCPARIS